MELKFTGRGAMLYPQEGNTAAYFEEGNSFFLFDCGEDVASKLILDGKLNREKDYYLFISHTHSDHVGSIGTLQQYLYWVCGKKLNIVCSEQMHYLKEVQTLLDAFGLVPDTYQFIDEKSLDNRFEGFEAIRFIPSNHGDVPIKSCSFVIKGREGNILYTGDIADSEVIKQFLSFSNNHVDKMYVDTSSNRSPVHLSLEELDQVIPFNLKDKVYCMHLNNGSMFEKISECGFHTVTTPYDLESLTVEELQILSNHLQERLTQIEQRMAGKKANMKK